jgi:hypothetical protein
MSEYKEGYVPSETKDFNKSKDISKELEIIFRQYDWPHLLRGLSEYLSAHADHAKIAVNTEQWKHIEEEHRLLLMASDALKKAAESSEGI